MGRSGLPTILLLSAAALAAACGDAVAPSSDVQGVVSPESLPPRAAPPKPAVPSPADPLDAVLSGRTIREWIAATSAEGDPASPTCLAARAALRADPAATVEAIVAWGNLHPLEDGTDDSWRSAGLPELLGSLIPDVRDGLVPRLLRLLRENPARDDEPASAESQRAREFALRVLVVIADSRSFGPHDSLVADELARQPLDSDACAVLASLGSAFAPVAASVLRPLGETPAGDLQDGWWYGLGGAAPEVASILLPPDGAATRTVEPALDWLLRNAGRIGPAIPALVARLGAVDPDQNRHELGGVLRILARSADPAALAAVVERARSTDPETRAAACLALAECPVASAGVAEALAALTADENDDVRSVAVRAQMNYAAISDAALDAVVARLRSDDAATRRATATSFEETLEATEWSSWKSAVTRPLARRLYGGRDAAVRETLLRALPPERGVLSPIEIDSLLHDPDARVRDAAGALDRRPSGAGEAEVRLWAELLAECRWTASLSDPHGTAAFELVLRDFRQRGGSLDALVGDVRRRLSGPEEDRERWLDVVARLGLRAAPLREFLEARQAAFPASGYDQSLLCALAACGGDVTHFLVARLTGANARLWNMDQVLRRLPPSAFPAVADALGHTDARVRAAFALALGWMDVPRDEADRALVPLLSDPVGYVRWTAAAALIRLHARPGRASADGAPPISPGAASPGTASPGATAGAGSASPGDLAMAVVVRELDAWPFLERLPSEWDDRMAWDCLGALLRAVADSGPAAAPAFEVLHRGLRSPETYASHVDLLCRAMASIGSAAAPAVPELAAIVERRGGPSGLDALPYGNGFYSGPDPYTGLVAISAAAALGSIGPHARAALPSLRRAALSTDLRISDAAAAAIRAIEGR